MEKANPRIAYLTGLDSRDRRSWSGVHYQMARALQKHCGDVTHLGPVKPSGVITGRAIAVGLKCLTGRKYLHTHTKSLSRQFARLFRPKIEGKDFDLIFASAASTELASLETTVPVIYTSDATVALLIDRYPGFKRPFSFSVREANTVERMAIEKARLVLYSSTWAAQSAQTDYYADNRKVHVVPYGANIDEWPPRDQIRSRRRSQKCQLLFVGVHWERKGGEIAFETLVELEKLGVLASLTIVGCVPPKRFRHSNMRVIPFLDKRDPRQREQLNVLFLNADFFLLPTRAECCASVFGEANAFGVPVIATDVGGCSEAVKNSENGYLLSPDCRGHEYARLIKELYLDDKRCLDLRNSSREQFETRLNWDVWGRTVSKLISAVI